MKPSYDELVRYAEEIGVAWRAFVVKLQHITYPGYICGDAPRYTIPNGREFHEAIEAVNAKLRSPDETIRAVDAAVDEGMKLWPVCEFAAGNKQEAP
jgi:hypothetical protein